MSAAVLRLPTAAPCKVRQGGRRATRAARSECIIFPIDRVRYAPTPQMKRDEETARKMLATDSATAMQMALAIYSVMDETQQLRLHGRIVALTMLNRTGADSALAWLHYEKADKCRKAGIDYAAHKMLERGEVE